MSDNMILFTDVPQDSIHTHATDPNTICFHIHEKEILRLEGNGDIYVNGRLAENDQEVVDGMRKFLERGMIG